jgi:hypothetical protein
MPRGKKTTEESEDLSVTPISRKEELLALYKQLKDLGINSISDLENLIARAE